MIAELEQARVDPAWFSLGVEAGGPPGRAIERIYSRELAAIYRRYRDELATRERDDAETFAWGALDALRERPESWGATPVFLYGFDDLTPVELDAVETLSQYVGAAVTVSLTYEPDRPALAARAERRRGAAGARGQAVTQLPALDEYYATDSRAPLHHLERHLFEADPPVLDPHAAIGLMEAGSERTEAELVASEVLFGARATASTRGKSSSSAARWRARLRCSNVRSRATGSRPPALAGFRSGTRRLAGRCWGSCATRCFPVRSARWRT